MPADDSPAVLVAKYLRSSGYKKTLSAFLEESGILDSQISSSSDLTIEKVLEEKRLYDLSVKLERVLTVGDTEGGLPGGEFALSYPTQPIVIGKRGNYVFVTLASFGVAPADVGGDGLFSSQKPLIIGCTVSGELGLYEVPTTGGGGVRSTAPVKTYTNLHMGPILAVCVLRGRYLLTGSMHGTVALHRAYDGKEIWRVKDHNKFVVKMEISKEVDEGDARGWWFATAGYDKQVHVYRIHILRESEQHDECKIEHVGSIEYDTTPEALCFIPPPLLPTHHTGTPPTQPPVLIVSRRDSTKVYYYSLLPNPALIKYYELVPETTSHIIFSPMSLALSPGPQPFLAIVTDSVPVMKYLLLEPHTGRVLVESFTGAPQTAYSTGIVVWRPSGRGGVWVNADDGFIRGVEAGSGKVVVELGGAHARRRKVRTLWAGEVEGREVLVSGGFDGQLVLWEVVQESQPRVVEGVDFGSAL
ncbi:WD40-repeat-containing domain protein [Terfezia claveryi]|nr:WD40-repeat-containing domain protein [Terfezia claveryi]